MKNIVKFSLIAVLAFLAAACSDDDRNLFNIPEAIRLYDPNIATMTLNINHENQSALRLTWTDQTGTSGGEYTVLLSSDMNMENPIVLGTTTENHFDINTAAFNTLLNGYGYNPYEPLPVYIRIVKSEYHSNIINFAVRTYAIDGPQLTGPESGSSYTLSADQADQDAVTFTWTDYDYGITGTNVSYQVQIIEEGGNWDEPIILGNTSSNSFTATHNQLNTAALNAGLDANSTGNIEVRVVNMFEDAAGNNLSFHSNVITIGLETFSAYFYRDLYLVGEATAAGWDPNNNNHPIFRSESNPNQYQYVGYFTQGGFKLIEELGQWQPQWGQNGGVVAVNDGSGSDPDVFTAPGTGYYTFTLNTTALTYSIEPYDASAATTYNSIGIIGNATPGDWAADTPMTQSTFNPHIWYLHNVTLTSNEMKFRANADWGVNWGGTGAFGGQATFNGPNIVVSAGVYDIWFNDLDGRYMLIPQ
ncbi:MAG: SusE domain-containing protein [Weeksellaceae bacterium]|nr:SusE domain-containing protein [Weeksellaceae bacterium]